MDIDFCRDNYASFDLNTLIGSGEFMNKISHHTFDIFFIHLLFSIFSIYERFCNFFVQFGVGRTFFNLTIIKRLLSLILIHNK